MASNINARPLSITPNFLFSWYPPLIIELDNFTRIDNFTTINNIIAYVKDADDWLDITAQMCDL